MEYSEISKKYNVPESKIKFEIEQARRSMAPKTKTIEVSEYGQRKPIKVARQGIGPLETAHGCFFHFSFDIGDEWKKYSALVMADLTDRFMPIITRKTLLMRIDSGCETGQLFGDMTCECREQLMMALQHISQVGEGLLINIPRQDGRGMGLSFKLATLRLQTYLGVDTVEASAMLEPLGSRDVRTYAGVVAILKFFGISNEIELTLMTNNPRKLEVFEENDYRLGKPAPLVVAPTKHTLRHLVAKQKDLGHKHLVADEDKKGGTEK